MRELNSRVQHGSRGIDNYLFSLVIDAIRIHPLYHDISPTGLHERMPHDQHNGRDEDALWGSMQQGRAPS
jgi:hypothetical protein